MDELNKGSLRKKVIVKEIRVLMVCHTFGYPSGTCQKHHQEE